MKCARVAAVVAGFGLVLVLAAVATASSSAGGNIRLFVAGKGNVRQNVLLAGAIGDDGTATSVGASGKPDPNGNFEALKLQNGSLLVDATGFNAAGNSARPAVASAKTCSFAVSWSGTASIVSGTSVYNGVTGTLKLHGTFAGISARFKSGSHKGECQMSQNATPKALFVSVTGTGEVS